MTGATQARGTVPASHATGGPAPQVVLHQFEISPFCAKVRKILRAKGVAYRVENYHGLRAWQIRRLTPAGQLPVLDWDDERVHDSTAIAAFLEQRRPTPRLFPSDSRLAATARLLADWADGSLHAYEVYLRVEYAQARERAMALLCTGRPAWELSVFAPIATRRMRAQVDAWGLTRRDAAAIEAAFLRRMDDLDATLAGRAWLVGEQLSIADIAVSAQLDEIVRTSTLADRLLLRPQLARWLAQLAP